MVGIRELKARLSEYVERAARGEQIVITHRGRPKAVIGPVSYEARVDQGVAEGWLRPGQDVPPSRRRPRYSGRRTVDEVLREDRGE